MRRPRCGWPLVFKELAEHLEDTADEHERPTSLSAAAYWQNRSETVKVHGSKSRAGSHRSVAIAPGSIRTLSMPHRANIFQKAA
jgi:hypothetical protein